MGDWIAAAYAIGKQIYDIGKTIYDALKWGEEKVTAFLDLIHFDTLMRLNDLAQIVSPKYRGIMRDVYREISAFSSSIGFGAHGIATALENVRAITLDVSAMRGEPYDIGKVKWLSDLHDIMIRMARQSSILAREPSLLFELLLENVEARRYEQGRTHSRQITQNIASLLNRADIFVNAIADVGRDLRTFRNDLPSEVRKLIDPMLAHVLDPVEHWKTDTFNPLKKDYEAVKNALTKRADNQEFIARDFANRLSKPGQLLGGIWNLPDDEREIEEKITDIVVASELNRAVENEYTYQGVTQSALESVVRARGYKKPPPAWYKREMEGTPLLITKLKQTRVSPFVGDY